MIDTAAILFSCASLAWLAIRARTLDLAERRPPQSRRPSPRFGG